MQSSDVQLVARIGKYAKARLFREAQSRGVETSALLRAILQRHFADVGDEVLGFVTETETVIQVRRPDYVELHVPRRRLSPRSRASR